MEIESYLENVETCNRCHSAGLRDVTETSSNGSQRVYQVCRKCGKRTQTINFQVIKIEDNTIQRKGNYQDADPWGRKRHA